MKSSPFAAWLVVLLVAGLGVMGCGKADVPFSPEVFGGWRSPTG